MGALSGHRRNRGVAVVLVVGVIAFFLLLFFVVGIDFAYIYVVRGEMQNAADAAALAGAAVLSDPGDTNQFAAREKAKEFAMKNIAALDPVVLISNTPDEFSPGDNELHEGNDITVGHWDPATGVYTRGALPVNALEVRPRRSDDNPGTGGAVELFFGRIIGRPSMEVSTKAVAASSLLDIAAIPLCLPSCGIVTPLTVVSPNITPGKRFFFRTQDGSPNVGWSSFLENDTSQPNISAYIRGDKIPPPICNECIHTTEGLVTPSLCELRKRIRKDGTLHEVNGVEVFGWKVVVPILPPTPCPSARGTGCITSDPGYQPGDPYEVVEFAQLIITDAVPTGNCPGDPDPYAPGKPGVVMVGLGPGVSMVNSTISCIDCNDPSATDFDRVTSLVK